MIRTILTANQQTISFQVPDNYIGKQVEVIAFTIDETLHEPERKDKTVTHFASEAVLSKEWLTREEDQAWKNL
jgi:hypothetical protein